MDDLFGVTELAHKAEITGDAGRAEAGDNLPTTAPDLGKDEGVKHIEDALTREVRV
jgi:hypothetical protein